MEGVNSTLFIEQLLFHHLVCGSHREKFTILLPVIAMEAVIEVNGFIGNDGEFIAKELAVVDSNLCYSMLFFRPPYPKSYLDTKQQRTVGWLERNHHCIDWDYGSQDFKDETMRVICSRFDVVYTKGNQKIDFLRRHHSNVKEIPQTAPKPGVDYKKKCWFH